jgi:ABC-type nitrate/sulfonate/bicarbonate transport system substrate-binding protein
MKIKIRSWRVLFCVMTLAALSLSACTKQGGPGEIEKIRLGVSIDPVSALVYIAQEQKMFKRHGLDASLLTYQTGAYAMNDLLTGKVDVVTASGFVLVLQGFKRDDLRILATISSSDNVELVARKDRKIEKPEDLRGKRVGVSKATIAEFYLGTFLSFSGILPSEVRTVDLKPSDIVTALSEGKIDAASCFAPFSDAARKNLAANAVSWSAQGGQDYYFLLITTAELIKIRPRVVEGLLRGVLAAEDYLKKHESKAQSIVERTLNLDREAVRNTWSKTRFRVRLDQDLLTLMEDEARWAIRNRLVDAKKIPNYFPFLHLEGLEQIKPEAVGVIH